MEKDINLMTIYININKDLNLSFDADINDIFDDEKVKAVLIDLMNKLADCIKE